MKKSSSLQLYPINFDPR